MVLLMMIICRLRCSVVVLILRLELLIVATIIVNSCGVFGKLNSSERNPSTTAPMSATSGKGATTRATSASALYDRYDSKGHYGPECTQKNILHTRHKILFQYGRIRRLQSSELGELIDVVKKGMKSAGKVLEKEDREKMGEDYTAEFGQTSFVKKNNKARNNSMRNTSGGGSGSGSVVMTSANVHSHRRDDNHVNGDDGNEVDPEFASMQRKDTDSFLEDHVRQVTREGRHHDEDDSFTGNNNNNVEDEDGDDEIEAAFKSGQLSKSNQQQQARTTSAKPQRTNQQQQQRPMTAVACSASASCSFSFCICNGTFS